LLLLLRKWLTPTGNAGRRSRRRIAENRTELGLGIGWGKAHQDCARRGSDEPGSAPPYRNDHHQSPGISNLAGHAIIASPG
jgi:hypothetical protein